MISYVIIVCSALVSVQCQIFAAPYPRQVPAMIPNCQCGGPMPAPTAIPVAAPPPRVLVNKPLGCLEPTVTKYGTVAEVPVPAPVPLPYGNPFLPAASPVSALTPFSPCLPPANTCSRCQYLKKIPIPPPYI